jgi:methionine aminopeptidase
MVEIKTAGEIDAIRAASQVVAEILAAARSCAAPGVTLAELDRAARDVLAKVSPDPVPGGHLHLGERRGAARHTRRLPAPGG